MSKKHKKKKLTTQEASVKIAKYGMIGAWAYPAYELIKQLGKLIKQKALNQAEVERGLLLIGISYFIMTEQQKTQIKKYLSLTVLAIVLGTLIKVIGDMAQ